MIRSRGFAAALGITRTLSRTVKDAARLETPFSRAFNARYGYLMMYDLPLSKAVVAPVAPKASPSPTAVEPRRV